MVRTIKLAIVSDIHYASAAERARGGDFETRGIANPLLRGLVRAYRHYIWLREPLNQNHLLDRFLKQADGSSYVIANGDYSCNSACVGVSDDAACQSARECLTRLREKFDGSLRAIYGDHELGKVSFFGGRGGLRLASWQRAQQELGLTPFWRLDLGQYVLIGVVSTLVGLPVYRPETLPEELPEWERLRIDHLAQIAQAFAELKPQQRVLLFCHDPTALPFLWREEAIQPKLTQVEQTVIGHLHSNLVLWHSRWLAGMPKLSFLGNTARRLSTALREARHWRPFHVRLCPALAGIQLLNDGGFLMAELDPEAARPVSFRFCAIPR
jgi:hypothetical protein